jgi:hypothetical protein
MKSLEKHKTTLISIILFIAVIMLYKTFFKVNSAVTTESTSAASVGSDLIDLYGKLQNVSFDQTLFNMPGYRSLLDFSTVLVPQPTGRTNPFDQLGK